MTNNSELGVALIGTGFMGRLHSLAYSILPSFFPELPRVRRRRGGGSFRGSSQAWSTSIRL